MAFLCDSNNLKKKKKNPDWYSQPITEVNAWGDEKILVLNVYRAHLDSVEEVSRVVINLEINI